RDSAAASSLGRKHLVAEWRRLEGRQSWIPDLYEAVTGRFMTGVACRGQLAEGGCELRCVFRTDRVRELVNRRLHHGRHFRSALVGVKPLSIRDGVTDLCQLIIRQRPVLDDARVPQLEMP